MRICFVTPEFVTEPANFDGGLSNYLYRVALSLIQLGHEPVIVVISDRNDVFLHQTIEIHRVEPKTNYPPPLSWIYQSWLLNDYLNEIHRSNPFDIIQYTSFTATGLFRMDSAPCVVRTSSIHALLMSNYDIPQDETHAILEKLESDSLKIADGVFGPSRIIADEFCKNSGLEIKVIESPYIEETEKADEKIYTDNLAGKEFLLFFGSIGILKGAAVIAEILEELLMNHPGLYFVFVGKDGVNGNQSMVQYIYEKSGKTRDRIIWLDKLPHAQLYPIIRNANAVVLPSRIDNFPNTCIEAMAHGKVVIGTKNTGFDQLITDKISGFLCVKDNPVDLLNTIEQVISLPIQEKLRVEENAIKRVELLKPEIVVNELIDYYTFVITRFREVRVYKRSEADDILTKVYWQFIEHLENKINENQIYVKNQDALINSIYHSYSFRIGKALLYPFSRIKNLLKKS